MLSNSLQKVVLIVEDDELMQDLIQNYLNSLDVEIVSAYNGEEGYRKYRELLENKKRPNVVIIDINMPVVDGIEATRRIIELDPSATIYGFTAFYGTDKTRELREAGAKKIFPRSIGFKAFRNIIENSLVGQEVQYC